MSPAWVDTECCRPGRPVISTFGRGTAVDLQPLGAAMQSKFRTVVVAIFALVALTAMPAAAQHRGGGHSGGGHGGGSHSGGRHASGAAHGGGHVAGGGHVSSGRTVVGHAVPRTSVARPRIDQHTTLVLPSHRAHVGLGAFGLGLGVGAYRYPYGYGYPRYYGSSSGYYGYARGSHARLRVLGAPPYAEVYVDGYYAGIVDDFDGTFQHLELVPGPHQIEIRAPGFAPIVFDMQAIDGRTITYRAQMVPLRP